MWKKMKLNFTLLNENNTTKKKIALIYWKWEKKIVALNDAKVNPV